MKGKDGWIPCQRWLVYDGKKDESTNEPISCRRSLRRFKGREDPPPSPSSHLRSSLLWFSRGRNRGASKYKTQGVQFGNQHVSLWRVDLAASPSECIGGGSKLKSYGQRQVLVFGYIYLLVPHF